MAEIISSTVLWGLVLDDLHLNNSNVLEGCSIDRETFNVSEPADSPFRTIAACSLLRSIVKKFQDEIDQEAADKAAWDLFHDMNKRCQEWTLRTEELGPYDQVLHGEFRQAMYEFFHKGEYALIDHAELIPHLDFGPGSSPGAESEDFITKIGESKLSASSNLLIDMFNEWVRDHPTRVDCEIARLLAMGPAEVVKAVKMSAVLKTSKISRLVKPEPLLNMFFQKGVQKILEDQLRHEYGIDLAQQPRINAALAKVGSITRKYATVDLKSASDCIANRMCEEYIPRSSYSWLKCLRSGFASTDRGIAELHMIATMGNAFCFPLQTAIFACVVQAAYSTLGLPFIKRRVEAHVDFDVDTGEAKNFQPVEHLPNWGVFGDDIVVLEEALPSVLRLLRALGFIPNMEKSFGRDDGWFRESCGSDYYKGSNVRGVYAKSLKTMQDRYTLINNLVDWSARTGLSLPFTISFLRSKVKDVAIPPWENPDGGIRMPETCLRPEHKVYKAYKSWSGLELQGSYLYKRYVARPNLKYLPVSEDDDTATVPKEASCYWNSSAAFLAALKGQCRGGFISLRMWETKYKKRIGVAPCWDYIAPNDSRYGYRRQWFFVATVYFEG